MDEEDDDLGEEESESADDAKSEFQQAAEEAFPGQPWDKARLAALKDLMHQCMEGYADSDDRDVGRTKPGADLLLAFGKPSKK